MDMNKLENELGKSTYERIEHELRSYSDDDLFALLDSRSIRIGDTAADYIAARRQHDVVIDGLLNARFKTALGRLRATNILLPVGKQIPRAEAAYLYALTDKSTRVVGNALFGLVFWQNKKNIPAIESLQAKAKPGSEVFHYCEKAIKALKNGDPFLFAPNFSDPADKWQLRTRDKRTDS